MVKECREITVKRKNTLKCQVRVSLLINTHSFLEFLGLFLVFCRSVSRGSQVWAPEGSTAFKCLLSARFCAALLSNISDCDETFNYWEPVSDPPERLKCH